MRVRLQDVRAGDTNLEVIIVKTVFKATGVMRSREESAWVRKKADPEQSPAVGRSDPGQGRGPAENRVGRRRKSWRVFREASQSSLEKLK